MSPVFRQGIVVVWLAFVVAATAAGKSDWSLHTWQSDDGLPNNNVTGLAQTGDGYLWIANPSRLARFDGVRFENIAGRDIVPDTRQKFTTLLRSHDGGMWLGMDRGTVVYLDGKATKIFTNHLPDEYVNSLVEDSDGSVWVTFSGDTICRIRDGTVTRFGRTNGLPASYACWLARDVQGTLWWAKGAQVGIFSKDQFVSLFDFKQPVNGIAASSGNGVWLEVGNHLFHADQGNRLRDCGAFVPQKGPPQPAPLLEDNDHSVWIGTVDSGLYRYDGNGFEKIPVTHRQVSCLFKDNEDNLWVGTGGGGLDRVNRRAITLEGTENGLPFEAIQSLCEDTNGVIWATTQNGFVVCRSNETWHVAITNRTHGGMASCLTAGTNGAVWIGTHGAVVDCWQDGEVTYLGRQDGLQGRIVHSLLMSRSGDIWLGEENPESIQRYRHGKFDTFPIPPDLRVIRAMIEDARGNIWVGTSRGNLLRINGDQVFDETTNTTGTQMAIRCFHLAADGSLWIGYAGWGLGRLKDGHFNRISVEQGLYDFNISEILADDRGWMWFGADHGIFKVRQQELEAVMDGREKTVQCVHYGRDEGLPSLQANFGDSSGFLRSRDGRLWMPMRTALAIVDPDKVPGNGPPANPRLEQIVVDGQTLAWYGGILPSRGVLDPASGARLHLLPGHHSVRFEFTAPDFAAPENVRFRYRLAGFDDHWIDAAGQRNAVYPRLPAGSYEFQVMACNGDGVWSKAAATMAFTVAPFFWQTWWFEAGLSALLLAVIVGIVRYVSFRRLRMKLQMLEHQAALDKERARIAKDLHDDLGTRLTKIILLTGLAQRDLAVREKAGEHLQKISSAAQRVVKSLDETVWAVNPRNDTLSHLINYIGQFAIEFLHSAEIRCRVDLPENLSDRVVPAAARHNLFMAVKEALNNIVRHSSATEVWLRIAATDESLEILLEDNGCGIGLIPANGTADGLHNMQQRLEEIGGRFQLQSGSGSGTKISFSCPWQNGN